MTDGLSCSGNMPLAWRASDLDEPARQGMMREAALLLAALNLMEGSHELESGGPENRRLDRLEAKLDLVLYLLAHTLEPGPPPASRRVTLTPGGVEWNDDALPAAGSPVILSWRPSEQLPLTLRLPATALEPLPGIARVRLDNPPEALDDALHQFVFCRHRQAIRARAGG